MKRLLGAHMSIAGGFDKAIERGQSIGCTAIQIFVKSNHQWFGKPINQESINKFLKLQKESGMFVFAHAGYLLNLAAENPELHDKSIKSILEELEKCEQLHLPFLVFHPGSNPNKEEGIKKVSKALNHLIKETKGYKVKLAIETTAGQGNSLGCKFENLAAWLNDVKEPARLGLCIDTCHMYAAGYDIKTDEGYKKTFNEFDKLIGIDKLLAFHLNDSKKDLNSRVDRHEHIGKGFLGKEPFARILNDKRFSNLPMVLETPKEEDLK